MMACANVQSAQIYYDSDVQIYVRGGIKHGMLKKEDFWVSVSPRVITHNVGMRVYLFAKDKTSHVTTRFAVISCAVGNSKTEPQNVTITYWGKSCNLAALPNGSAAESVQVPDNAELTASTTTTFEAQPGLRNIVTTLRTFYVQERKNWKSCEDAKNEPKEAIVTTGRKSLGVHVYIIPVTTSGGVISGRVLCLAVKANGAAVQNRAFTGSIYSNVRGRQTYLGTFICNYGDKEPDIGEDSTAFIAECTGNEHPSSSPAGENSGLKVGGKLEVKLSFSFDIGPTTNDLVYENNNQPILPYPPPNLPQ